MEDFAVRSREHAHTPEGAPGQQESGPRGGAGRGLGGGGARGGAEERKKRRDQRFPLPGSEKGPG